jgi:hypothetical protein
MNTIKFILTFIGIYGLIISTSGQQNFVTTFEKSQGQETTTYAECIDYYIRLADQFESIQTFEMGITDSGRPLHIVLFDTDPNTDYQDTDKIKVLILNAIHPGEPAGVDASMMFIRDLAKGTILREISSTLMVSVIPIFNIGGSLERGSFGRVNQKGPKEYGFRGNSKNLDLNRDFIKMDSRNVLSLVQWYHQFDPEIFVDTHTSNGADYQYTITCLDTHPQKLGGLLGEFQKSTFTPALFASMKEKGFEMAPFVNIYGSTPEKGYKQFLDHPRYSTGFTALFQTIGYMSEAHMLKTFEERVDATYGFLLSLTEIGSMYRNQVKLKRVKDRYDIKTVDPYVLSWTTDQNMADSIFFKGYKARYIKSKITGGKRLYYDHRQPYDIKIPYYTHLLSDKKKHLPKAYIIPQPWKKVMDHLKTNNIVFSRFLNDTIMDVELYFIEHFDTYSSPYEGHYPHQNTTVKTIHGSIAVHRGDYYVPTNQPGVKYLMQTLEPEAKDSFFNWNFFDSILQQKEHFSDYIFEETAERILKEKPWLIDSLEDKREKDERFKNDHHAQLDYLYKHSDHFERSYRKYPIYRVKH